MPAGDRRGPQGMGPRTGRGMGYCTGHNAPGYMNQGFGGGFNSGNFGRHMFGGRGFRNMYHATGQPGWMRSGGFMNAYPQAPMTPEQEQEALKEQETWLQSQLDAVRSELEKNQKKD